MPHWWKKVLPHKQFWQKKKTLLIFDFNPPFMWHHKVLHHNGSLEMGTVLSCVIAVVERLQELKETLEFLLVQAGSHADSKR